ncbi:hypothetical protein NL108_009567, partial [Boleophthalmus pectinirostris]
EKNWDFLTKNDHL